MKRIVKIQDYENEFTTEINFEDLRIGDVFRMYDVEEINAKYGACYYKKEICVIDENGNDVFIATSDPYRNDDGIWQIDCEPLLVNI